MKNERIAAIIFSAQAVGTVFYGIFLSAYFLTLPATENLIGDPTFRLSLQVFGGLFLISVVAALVACIVAREED